jgi:hypothetical protein
MKPALVLGSTERPGGRLLAGGYLSLLSLATAGLDRIRRT